MWDEAERWPKECYVSKGKAHGGSFNGNACRTLLNKIDLLQSLAPIQALPFIAAFRALKTVVDGCFGSELNADIKRLISEFKDLYLDLEINITPKIHCVFFHVPAFCLKYGHGLGRHSEQASESVHSDFQKIWCKYKVNVVNPKYGTSLLRAVTEYNSRHIK